MITTGTVIVPTIMKTFKMEFTLNTETMEVHADKTPAGHVIESIPGKLYYFRALGDTEYKGSFDTTENAARWGAVRHALSNQN